MAVSTFQVRRTADRRRVLARHARATRPTGRARSRRAQRPRRCPGVWLLFETTTSSLALAHRLSPRSIYRHRHPSSQVPCRDTRAHSFAGRHFELVRRGSRGAAAPHHRLRNLTVASEIHDEIAVSRSGNCCLLCGAGAILRYSGCYVLFLCYASVIRALFLRYSCVILALFLRYSCFLFFRYSAAILALFLWLFPRHHPPLPTSPVEVAATHAASLEHHGRHRPHAGLNPWPPELPPPAPAGNPHSGLASHPQHSNFISAQ